MIAAYGAVVVGLAAQALVRPSGPLTRELHYSKPLYFALAFLATTLALGIPSTIYERAGFQDASLARATTIFGAAGLMDLLIIVVQQQRGVPSHFNETGLASLLLTATMSALSFVLLGAAILYVWSLTRLSRGWPARLRRSAMASAVAWLGGIGWGFVMIAVGYHNIRERVPFSRAVTLGGYDLRTGHLLLLAQFPLTLLAVRIAWRSHAAAWREAPRAPVLLAACLAVAAVVVALALRFEGGRVP